MQRGAKLAPLAQPRQEVPRGGRLRVLAPGRSKVEEGAFCGSLGAEPCEPGAFLRWSHCSGSCGSRVALCPGALPSALSCPQSRGPVSGPFPAGLGCAVPVKPRCQPRSPRAASRLCQSPSTAQSGAGADPIALACGEVLVALDTTFFLNPYL